MKKAVLLPLLLFFALHFLSSNESTDRYIRLVIDEKNGTFSIHYLIDPEAMVYEPLLNPKNSKTTFLSVNADGKIYHLGKSRKFKINIDRVDRNPAIIFESSFMLVSIVFTPVRTLSSPNANGIKASVRIENKMEQDIDVGLRLLLDTHLNEKLYAKADSLKFLTANTEIKRETIIKGTDESYWIAQGEHASLMGNIMNLFNDMSKQPDYVHIANWKRLNNAPWNAPYRENKSFNFIPYSIGDAAVCYYWEPETLPAFQSFFYTVYLTTEDTSLYIWPNSIARSEYPTINVDDIEAAAANESLLKLEDSDLITLRMLQSVIDQFIAGEIMLNEQDLIEIERTVQRLEAGR